MKFTFMKKLRTDYTHGTLATTKQQSQNASTEMTPLSSQKHNLVTLKRDALWLSNYQQIRNALILNSNDKTVNTCETEVP